MSKSSTSTAKSVLLMTLGAVTMLVGLYATGDFNGPVANYLSISFLVSTLTVLLIFLVISITMTEFDRHSLRDAVGREADRNNGETVDEATVARIVAAVRPSWLGSFARDFFWFAAGIFASLNQEHIRSAIASWV